MPVRTVAELPDPICSTSTVATPASGGSRTIRAQIDRDFVAVNIGPTYIGMSVRNWRAVFAAIESLDAPQREFRLVVDDEVGTARMEPVK